MHDNRGFERIDVEADSAKGYLVNEMIVDTDSRGTQIFVRNWVINKEIWKHGGPFVGSMLVTADRCDEVLHVVKSADNKAIVVTRTDSPDYR